MTRYSKRETFAWTWTGTRWLSPLWRRLCDYFGDTKTLDVHIKRIRSRMEENPSEPRMLVTVRGFGYRFESD